MPAIQQLYLRLCLVQGLCLAAGFWACTQLQWGATRIESNLRESHAAAPAAISVSGTTTKAAIVAFLGTWSLLAGGTGLLLLSEQRRQLKDVLDRHSEPEPKQPDLNVIARSIDDQLETLTLQLPVSIVPPSIRLRLADSQEDVEMMDDAEEPERFTLTLHR